MTYGNVLCVGNHSVDLGNGKTLGPFETAVSVDLDDTYISDAIAHGHLLVVASVPVDSPRDATPAAAPILPPPPPSSPSTSNDQTLGDN